MNHQSFDMHFFRDRTGKWCVSYTAPSGRRSDYHHVLDTVELIHMRWMSHRFGFADLPWLQNDPEPTRGTP